MEIKGSRFLVYVQRVLAPQEAAAHLAEIRAAHPDASHHCWAYRIAEQYRFSDDGEPGGTAGRPMLEVLERRQLDRVSAVIVRYFGGTKLGAGGLVRAYSGSLAKALDQTEIHTVLPHVRLHLSAPFAMMDTVFRFIDSQNLARPEPQYTAQGLTLAITLVAGAEEAFALELINITKGEAQVTQVEALPLDG